MTLSSICLGLVPVALSMEAAPRSVTRVQTTALLSLTARAPMQPSFNFVSFQAGTMRVVIDLGAMTDLSRIELINYNEVWPICRGAKKLDPTHPGAANGGPPKEADVKNVIGGTAASRINEVNCKLRRAEGGECGRRSVKQTL